MNKPTRDEVLDTIATVNREGVEGLTRTEVRELGEAYLAQEEELESLKVEIEEVEMDRGVMVAANGRANKIIDQLKVENQELKRKGELLCCQAGVLEMENQELKASMEAEYIERQAKHIQELVEENEALKEALEGLDSLERYTHLYEGQQP